MATHPVPPVVDNEERPLTREEGWELLHSMRGILKESYAKLGGAEEYHRQEREAWNDNMRERERFDERVDGE
jgi:hypothetical protein